MLDKLQKYLSEDIWLVEREYLSRAKSWWIWILRTAMLTFKGFRKSQIQQGASSLTYYSLLGAVPLIALLFGIARGFLLEEDLKKILLEKFSVQEEAVVALITFAQASLTVIHRGVLAGAGLAIIIWSVMKILRNIEIVVNDIWEVSHLRSFAKQFSDYLALIFICPIILVVSSSLTIFLSTQVTNLGNSVPLLDAFHPIFFFLLNGFSFILNCALFTFLYIFIPNTQVHFKPALYAGLFTGTLYQVVQGIYIYFQVGVTSYNAIYGTFAAFPLFLIWLHVSWTILLLGAKIAFAFQHVDAYQYLSDEFDLSDKTKKLLALRITHYVIQAFSHEKVPPSKTEISHHLHIPLVLASHLLVELTEAKVIVEVSREEDAENCYLPGVPIESLTVKRVLDLVEHRGDSIPIPHTREYRTLAKTLDKFSALNEKSDANILLKDI